MNINILYQEIMLLAGTTFSKEELDENDLRKEYNLSASEKLEEACWNGLLDELLPEITANSKLQIWQIGDTDISLQIELLKYPSEQKQFSINPYYFLRKMKYN